MKITSRLIRRNGITAYSSVRETVNTLPALRTFKIGAIEYLRRDGSIVTQSPNIQPRKLAL